MSTISKTLTCDRFNLSSYISDLQASNGKLGNLESSFNDITTAQGCSPSAPSSSSGVKRKFLTSTRSVNDDRKYAILHSTVNNCTKCCSIFPDPYKRYGLFKRCQRFICRRCLKTTQLRVAEGTCVEEASSYHP